SEAQEFRPVGQISRRGQTIVTHPTSGHRKNSGPCRCARTHAGRPSHPHEEAIMLFRNTISRRAFLAGTAGAATLVVMHPFALRAAPGQAHLRIMETTDIHVAIYPYDYYADAPNDTMGLARTAALIENVRAEAGNS